MAGGFVSLLDHSSIAAMRAYLPLSNYICHSITDLVVCEAFAIAT